MAVVDSLLELNVPAEIGVIVVDFYRFSDLLFWSGQAAADDDVEHGLMNAQRQLLLPNVPAGYEFPVSHIPFLSKDWILKEYAPSEKESDQDAQT